MYWPSFFAGWVMLGFYSAADYYSAWLAGASSAEIAAVNQYCSNGGCF